MKNNTIKIKAFLCLLLLTYGWVSVQAQAVFEKSSVKVWECRNCGHIVVGTSAPKMCPACHYPQGYYEVREDVRGA